jgi:hypothetical protein
MTAATPKFCLPLTDRHGTVRCNSSDSKEPVSHADRNTSTCTRRHRARRLLPNHCKPAEENWAVVSARSIVTPMVPSPASSPQRYRQHDG